MTEKLKNALIVILCIVAALGAVFVFGPFFDIGNEPVPPTLQEGVIRVACIGDSITEGVGIQGDRRDSYPEQLQELLGDEYQTLNYGLWGRSLQKDSFWPYTEEKFYKISMEARPDIVLIMLGTNDTIPGYWNASNYEKELEEFARGYQDLDSAPVVYLMTPPPIFDEIKWGHNNTVIVNEVIPIIEKVAEKRGVQTIDVFSALTNHGDLFPDGVHPNAFGAKIIAETVYDVIKPVGVSNGTS